MKPRVLTLALALACAAAAADYPASAGYVNDFTGILPDGVQQALELRLRAYERATSNEVAVAIVSSLQGETAEDFAQGLFRHWGLGKQDKNNGVLFLWAPSERKVRIQVGYGLENILTDEVCAAILAQVTPLLRDERYSEAVQAAVDGIIRRLGETAPEKAPAPSRGHSSSGDRLGPLLIAGIAVLAIGFGLMHYHTTRTHQLQVEVPADIARFAELLRNSEEGRAQASRDLDALRAEAPREIWEPLQTELAAVPGHLQALAVELDRIRAERREEYRELSAGHRALRRWHQAFEKHTAVFTGVATTLQRFRESQEQALDQIARLSTLLDEMPARIGQSEQEERNRKLLSAARDTFVRARELRRETPANWLLISDLLDDTQACLDRLAVMLDPEANARTRRAAILAQRRERFWAGSDQQSAAYAELMLLMSAWGGQGVGMADNAAVQSAAFSGFGGGDTGSGGATSSY